MLGRSRVMMDLLAERRRQIVTACVRHGVTRLEVFGSAARGDFDPATSDVDLIVELGPMDLHARVDAYFGLLDELREILGTEVDLVLVDAIKDRYLAAEIERTKQVLYAA